METEISNRIGTLCEAEVAFTFGGPAGMIRGISKCHSTAIHGLAHVFDLGVLPDGAHTIILTELATTKDERDFIVKWSR